jgi:integrase
MSVRKRKWRDKQGRQHEKWMVHIEHTWPNGRKQTIRKVSPVQTKRGAEQYERELRSQLVSGQWKEGAKTKQTPTLKGFAKEFLEYQATINKASVIRKRKTILRAHLIPAFGSWRLDRIDERAIDAYKVEKLKQLTPQGTPLAPQTINGHLQVLGRMLRLARKWKLLKDVPEIGMLKVRSAGFDFLDFDEADAFMASAAEHFPVWHPYVVVAIRTGLRIGEMVALRWREDIDLVRGRLTVQQSHSRDNGFSTPKNDKSREIPLTWDALDALRAQREVSDGELVFTGSEGQVLTDKVTGRAIKKIAETIDMRHVHNHMLRHSFASHAVMRGIPIRQIQEWMGHADINVTMRYAHLSQGVGDELIQRLAPRPSGGASRGAARSQHMGSTGKQPPSNLPPQPPLGG